VTFKLVTKEESEEKRGKMRKKKEIRTRGNGMAREKEGTKEMIRFRNNVI
jgi:hypothetical protein